MKVFGGIVFDSEIVLDYMMEKSTYKAALLESGILREDPLIAEQMSEQGNKFTAPSFVPLTGRSQNHDGVSDITPGSITSKQQSGVVVRRDNAWTSKDLEAELASEDPQEAIGDYLGDYWVEEDETTLFLELKGAFAAASASALVDDISIADGDAATDANKMNSTTMITALFSTMGDAADKIVAVAVHTDIYASLVKQNLITFVPLSDQTTMVPKFLDKFVFYSDNFPKVAGGTSGYVYTSYFFAKQSVGVAPGKVKNPLEVEREALKNGGQDTLVSRTAKAFHPYGFSFTADIATSPTDTQLETGTNWALIYDKKNVGIMAMKTNG
jgi:hypothetical protein